MADDIAALIDHLELEKPDLVGYSLGGGVAFFTASKYPERVRKLVMTSAHINSDAMPAEMRAQQVNETTHTRGMTASNRRHLDDFSGEQLDTVMFAEDRSRCHAMELVDGK